MPQEEEYILFVVGSTWESRNYPKEQFIQVANSLKKIVYIIWGSEEEHKKAIWMSSNSKYIKILPKVTLDNLKLIIFNSKLLIGNDTGPTHMAWGLNKPSITLFGPTPINRVYITNINKALKSSSEVNHFKLDKNDFSIKEISAYKIVEIAQELL
jgi:heptosyltransferase-1